MYADVDLGFALKEPLVVGRGSGGRLDGPCPVSLWILEIW